MATTTYPVLRQNLNKRLNIPWTGTTTSAGGVTSLVCTGLQAWDQALDDFYNNMWVVVTSGTYSGAQRLISDYTAASGTVVPRPDFAGAPGNSVTFEIMPYDPSMVLHAFQRAVDLCYPNLSRGGLFREVYDESNAVDNWLWNPHFEDWTVSTIPDCYSLSGTATVSENSSVLYPIHGSKGTSSMKITGGGATDYVMQNQSNNPGLLDLQGTTVTFYVWAHAVVASMARLTIAYKVAADSGLTTASSSYHSGNSEWELLQKEVILPEDITDFQIRFESGGGTVYFDAAYMRKAPACYRYHLSKDFVHKPEHVWVQANDMTGTDGYGVNMMGGGEQWNVVPGSAWAIEDNGTDRMLVFNNNAYLPVEARKIRVQGLESLTSPTGESSTVEVAGEQMRALVAMATAELCKSLSMSVSLADNQIKNYQRLEEEARKEAEQLLRLHHMAKPYNILSGLVA